MNLEQLFPPDTTCLFSSDDIKKVWRITSVPENVLNYLRRWLENDLISVAIDWVGMQSNTSSFFDEYLAHRIGLIPIDADPLRMEDLNGKNFDTCSDATCISFELHVNNPGQGIKDVLSRDLKWVPTGDQAYQWQDRPPRSLYDDLLIARLEPGQEINLRAYAIRGTNDQHAKWGAALSHFRLISTRLNRFSVLPAPPVISTQLYLPPPPNVNQNCLPCEELIKVNVNPGFKCFYFTIELVSALSFQDIDRQLKTRFDWKGQSFQEPNYIF
jgi:hypothetical protein